MPQAEKPQAEKPEPTSKWPGHRVAHPREATGRVLHLTCEWCGSEFWWEPPPRGRTPRYCCASHRHRAYEARAGDGRAEQEPTGRRDALHSARLAARLALEDLRAGKPEQCERRLVELAGDLADGPEYQPGPRMSDWDRDRRGRRQVTASPTR